MKVVGTLFRAGSEEEEVLHEVTQQLELKLWM